MAPRNCGKKCVFRTKATEGRHSRTIAVLETEPHHSRVSGMVNVSPAGTPVSLQMATWRKRGSLAVVATLYYPAAQLCPTHRFAKLLQIEIVLCDDGLRKLPSILSSDRFLGLHVTPPSLTNLV